MKRHALPALAGLVLVAGGPQADRFEAIHAPRVVLLLVLAAALLARGRAKLGTVEWLALAALAAMGLSAAFATSPAYAVLPLALCAAACAVLLGTSGRDDRELWLSWLAGAVVVCAALGFVEALGLGPQSPPGRAPSGTHGQRNALAHVLLLGSPLAWSAALSARSTRERVAWWCGAALIAAVIVQTRSRAAWLMAGPVLLAFVLLSRRRAAAGSVVAVVAGAAAAALAPVALLWRSAHPYADSLARLVDSSSGSGAGRLAEWRASLELFASAPVLGVGPGNWFVLYGVRHGGSHHTHSDWVGLLVERGALGVVLVLGLGVAALWRWRGQELQRVVPVLLAAAGLGALDAVLQLPAPLLLVSVVLFTGARKGTPSPLVGERAVVRGPLSAAEEVPLTPSLSPTRGEGVLVSVFFAVLALAATSMTASLCLSTSQHAPFEKLELAAKLDPLDGELRFTLARAHASAGDCARAGPHLDALSRLLPTHPQLPALEAACPPATRSPPAAGEAR